MRPVKIVRYTDLGVPPSIARPPRRRSTSPRKSPRSPLRRPPIARARTGGRREGPGRPSPPRPRWPKSSTHRPVEHGQRRRHRGFPVGRCRHRHLAVARPTSSPSTRSRSGSASLPPVYPPVAREGRDRGHGPVARPRGQGRQGQGRHRASTAPRRCARPRRSAPARPSSGLRSSIRSRSRCGLMMPVTFKTR